MLLGGYRGAVEIRWVLSLDLKVERESQFNTAGGSEFQSGVRLNDRLANDVRRNGTHSSGTDDNRVLHALVRKNNNNGALLFLRSVVSTLERRHFDRELYRYSPGGATIHCYTRMHFVQRLVVLLRLITQNKMTIAQMYHIKYTNLKVQVHKPHVRVQVPSFFTASTNQVCKFWEVLYQVLYHWAV